jgi:hypothetical protein
MRLQGGRRLMSIPRSRRNICRGAKHVRRRIALVRNSDVIAIAARDSLDKINVFSLVVRDEVPAHSLPQRRHLSGKEVCMTENKKLFLSAVSSEFIGYRELLTKDLKRPTLDVAVQEDFVVTDGTTLEKLDT